MLIEWNVVNWITVVLMVALFWLVVGAGVSMLRQNLPEVPDQ